jgi:hypothetical protein
LSESHKASAGKGKAVLTLRNPSPYRKTFHVEVARVFELPGNTDGNYHFFDAMFADKAHAVAEGSSFILSLEPFEVKVMDAYPGQ